MTKLKKGFFQNKTKLFCSSGLSLELVIHLQPAYLVCVCVCACLRACVRACALLKLLEEALFHSLFLFLVAAERGWGESALFWNKDTLFSTHAQNCSLCYLQWCKRTYRHCSETLGGLPGHSAVATQAVRRSARAEPRTAAPDGAEGQRKDLSGRSSVPCCVQGPHSGLHLHCGLQTFER